MHIPNIGDWVRLTREFQFTEDDGGGDTVVFHVGTVCIVDGIRILPLPQGIQFQVLPIGCETYFAIDMSDADEPGDYPFERVASVTSTEA